MTHHFSVNKDDSEKKSVKLFVIEDFISLMRPNGQTAAESSCLAVRHSRVYFVCSVGQTDLGPAVLPVCSGLRELELHRSGSEEIHLRAAVQTANKRHSW